MSTEARVVEAIKASGVRTIAMIDDAFDPPPLKKADRDNALRYVQDPGFAEVAEIHGLAKARSAVLALLVEGELDAGEIDEFFDDLYAKYVETFDERLDPRDIFKSVKAENLANLRPLLHLLRKAGDSVNLKLLGSREDQLNTLDEGVHLIFADLFLDPTLAANDDTRTKAAADARAASLARVTDVVKRTGDASPSIVLMSSHAERDRADKFRAAICGDPGKVFAARFCFVEKKHLTLRDDSVHLESKAAEELLDIFQSHEFGRSLHDALACWSASAQKAAEGMRTEVAQLDLKDLAYLVRFRLAQEGQGLFEYLEWFLGECLVDRVARELDEASRDVDWSTKLEGAAAERIEGVFAGPTKKIAELYGKVRVEAARARPRKNYRLGDLYVTGCGSARRVSAVLTPDCDLIVRPDGSRRAPRLLTVQGKVQTFDSTEATVDNFVLIDGKPQNIRWNKKDVQVQELAGDWAEAASEKADFKFVGTLRPVYAQEVQRTVLHDLGRVGVGVAPALGVAATATVRYKCTGGKANLAIADASLLTCYAVARRNDQDKLRVLFKRPFADVLIEALLCIDRARLDADAVAKLEELRDPSVPGKLVRALSNEGVVLDEDVGFGIAVTARAKGPALPSTWCIIHVGFQADGGLSLDDA